MKEVFCREECQLLLRYNPEWNAEVVNLNRMDSVYRLGSAEGEIEEYALKMEHLSDRRFLSSLMKKKKQAYLKIKIINGILWKTKLKFINIQKYQKI